VFRLRDVCTVPARLPFASRLARAAISDPAAFWIMVVALRRYHALQKPLELHAYLRFLRRFRIARALEIGSLWGGTFYAHCAVTEADGQVISIDAQPADRRDAMAARFTRFARGSQEIACIWGDSHSEAARSQVDRVLRGRPLDLLFLDGDHSLEGVTRDFDMYAPLVRSGGIVALHDIAGDVPAGTGIPVFWRSLRGRFASFELVDNRDDPRGLGIGVIIKE
jgi:cephalosporin hydroxylase